MYLCFTLYKFPVSVRESMSSRKPQQLVTGPESQRCLRLRVLDVTMTSWQHGHKARLGARGLKSPSVREGQMASGRHMAQWKQHEFQSHFYTEAL